MQSMESVETGFVKQVWPDLTPGCRLDSSWGAQLGMTLPSPARDAPSCTPGYCQNQKPPGWQAIAARTTLSRAGGELSPLSFAALDVIGPGKPSRGFRLPWHFPAIPNRGIVGSVGRPVYQSRQSSPMFCEHKPQLQSCLTDPLKSASQQARSAFVRLA